ncbi:DUF3566 domain-containing protein [Jatrophihabitans endophyticus]|uniref:DUF3566 domain-containing protein n=1 Tax=Jatrophihabitans endophyticus TaxID=1206085 RepID=UPI0019DEAA1D|nr:DUF3566 domain-containing protein [Jatrophihabitans endophyticus]MBE7187787.1 DUF3566 domain-containing protein [Jatrophihabitans endophyticus]
MTQSPQRGQAAPRSTDLGPSGAQTSHPNGWGSGYPQTSSPDAPTGTLPTVSRDTPAPSPTSGESGSGDAGARARSARANRNRGPRRARLQLRHIDPWTVLKFSCVLSIALFLVWLIVVGVLFGVLDAAGIIGKINDTITTIQGGNAQPPVRAGIVFGAAAIIGVVDIVLFIALSTIGSLVYNLCADLVGGVEVTLSER